MARSKGTSVIDVAKTFATDEACLAYLEAARWPEGVRCLKCEGDRVSKFTTAESTRTRKNRKTGEVTTVTVPARHLYQCLNAECAHQFTATTGTLFHDTHLPLQKWFMAVALICNGKKGISAKQLERDLDVNYRTAWYLSHRIREAMAEGNGSDLLTGKVEMDETYVGGKYDRRTKRARYDKIAVFGMKERDGNVRAFQLPRATGGTINTAVEKNVAKDATMIYTDQSALYNGLVRKGFAREIVNHSFQFVRGDVHTNGIENFWSLFKRGLIGSFHKVSIKHLDRYLAEFCYRFNNRENEALFAQTIVYLAIAQAMPYAKLIAKPSKPSVE